MRVLCIDAGSSSIKFACYGREPAAAAPLYAGQLETANGDGVAALWKIVADRGVTPEAIGHRIVFGGPEGNAPMLASEAVLRALRSLRAWDPLHLNAQVAIVESASGVFPGIPQVLCFDTAFFHSLPPVAIRLPLPRALPEALRRYGFHGLSYEWAISSLGHPRGRVVLAHLGSGASLCAVRDGMPVETTMGYSVLGGLVMATRPGDIDPGALLALLGYGRSAAQLTTMLYEESGLRGVSGLSGDMRELLAARATNPDAAEAVALFVHQLRKYLGAMIATLGGIDTLVFTGGIGERAPEVREEACATFAFVGLELDADANRRNAATISSARSSVNVRVVPANENATIAQHVLRLLAP